MPKTNLESMRTPENRQEFRKMLKSGKYSRIRKIRQSQQILENTGLRKIPGKSRHPRQPQKNPRPYGKCKGAGQLLEKSWAVWKMQAFRKILENPLAVWKIQASRRIAGKSDEGLENLTVPENGRMGLEQIRKIRKIEAQAPKRNGQRTNKRI